MIPPTCDLYPSLLAVWDATQGNSAAVVQAALAAQVAGAKALHLDFMAPPFIHRETFGLEIIQQLRGGGVTLPLDCHLMTGLKWLEPLLDLRPWRVAFHATMAADAAAIEAALASIAASGAEAGLALDHTDAVTVLAPWLSHPACCFALLMTVPAGAGGQAFQPPLLEKLAEIRRVAPHLPVTVDGGVNRTTLPQVVAAGAMGAVAGSAIFNAQSVADNINVLKSIVMEKNIS